MLATPTMAAYAIPALRFMPWAGEGPVWQNIAVAQWAVKIGCTSLAKLTTGGGPVRAATTSPAKESTSGLTVEASLGLAHPPFESALLKAFSNLSSALPRQSGSTVVPLPAAFAWHASSPLAFLLVATSFDAAQARPSSVPPSGSAATKAATEESTIAFRFAASCMVAQPPLASAASNVLENFSWAFVRHASSTLTPFLRALARHATSPLTFLATAESFLTVHFCSGVWPAWVTVASAMSRLAVIVLVLGVRIFGPFPEVSVGRVRRLSLLYLLLDALDVPAPEPLHLAAELEVAADLVVVEDPEAVDHCQGSPGHRDHGVGIEGEVRLVRDREDHGLDAAQRGFQILTHPELLQVALVAEEPGQGVTRRRVRVLLLELEPVLDVRVVDAHVGSHLGEPAHDDLGAAVASVTHVLTVARAADQHLGAC